jgi:hypothetical protein
MLTAATLDGGTGGAATSPALDTGDGDTALDTGHGGEDSGDGDEEG